MLLNNSWVLEQLLESGMILVPCPGQHPSFPSFLLPTFPRTPSVGILMPTTHRPEVFRNTNLNEI